MKNQIKVLENNLLKQEIIKFSCSSILCFTIDYIVYIILLTLSNNIILSNLTARFISSITNFTINKNIVFKEKKDLKKHIIKYFSLVIIIIILNTIILKIISNIINPYFAKILTELILFILSFNIQKKYIFKGNNNNK